MTSKEACSQLVVWKWGVYVLGAPIALVAGSGLLLWFSLPSGGTVVSVTSVGFVVSCGGERNQCMRMLRAKF